MDRDFFFFLHLVPIVFLGCCFFCFSCLFTHMHLYIILYLCIIYVSSYVFVSSVYLLLSLLNRKCCLIWTCISNTYMNVHTVKYPVPTVLCQSWYIVHYANESHVDPTNHLLVFVFAFWFFFVFFFSAICSLCLVQSQNLFEKHTAIYCKWKKILS